MLPLLGHPTPIKGVIPPTERIMQSVIVDLPERGSHWFLREGRGRRHNDRGHALLTYRVKPCEETDYVSRGEYVVARALLEQLRGPFPAKTKFTTICGLPQCVNPDHWLPTLPYYPWKIETLDNGQWQAVSCTTWLGAEARVVTRSYGLDRIVHVVTIEPWAQRNPAAQPTALCGYVFDPRRMVLIDVPVTCKKGC